MSAEKSFLLVVAPDQESTAAINSSLRNAGINIQVLHSDHVQQAERLIREFNPFLLLYLTDSHSRFPIAQAAALAAHHNLFLGLMQTGVEDSPSLREALQTTACLSIASEEQLEAMVRRLVNLNTVIEHRRQQESHEKEITGRLELLLNSTSDPIAYLHEGLHVAANDAYLQLMGVSEFSALETLSLLEIAHSDNTDLKALIRGFSNEKYPQNIGFGLGAPGQDQVAVHLSFAPVQFDGEDCVQMMVNLDEQSVTTNLTSEKPEPSHDPVTANALSKASEADDPGITDPATGMFWRAPFMESLEHRFANMDKDRRQALFFIQLDDEPSRFDNFTVADLERYIELSANELLSCVQEDDDICRFNDVSYVAFASRSSTSGLKSFGEKIRAGIERMTETNPDHIAPTSCSVGYVLLNHEDNEPEHVLANARSAARLAAVEGNMVKRFRPALEAGVTEDEETAWIERIRYAIDNEDFYAVQHALMSLDGDSDELFTTELFMHEDDADLPMDQFLGAAERNQLASQIDRLVIPGILRSMTSGQGKQFIHISGNSLQDFSFPGWFSRQLNDSGVPGNRVILQWSAQAAQQQGKSAQRLISELASQKCLFSIGSMDDDSKSSELLQSMPVQYVALANTLTEDLQGSERKMDAVRQLIRLNEDNDIITIASNVQSSNDLATLWQCGVKWVTGNVVQDKPKVIGQ